MTGEDPPGLVAFDPIWLAGFRINGRKISNYRWGRAFLAGDVAHVQSPAGGPGMNTGMQDAFTCLETGARGSRDVRQRLLDSYGPERSKAGRYSNASNRVRDPIRDQKRTHASVSGSQCGLPIG